MMLFVFVCVYVNWFNLQIGKQDISEIVHEHLLVSKLHLKDFLVNDDDFLMEMNAVVSLTLVLML